MIKRVVNIARKERPVFLDRALQNIQDELLNRLPWLDAAFGKGHKLLSDSNDGYRAAYPAAYIGNAEYISLLPDDNLGNSVWFDIYDPQEISQINRALPKYEVSGALVFWYDLRAIYADTSALYTEEVKDEVIRALMTPGIVPSSSRLEVTRIFERPENIYKGYSLEKVQNKFFMYPYAGLRVEFELTIQGVCQKYIK